MYCKNFNCKLAGNEKIEAIEMTVEKYQKYYLMRFTFSFIKKQKKCSKELVAFYNWPGTYKIFYITNSMLGNNLTDSEMLFIKQKRKAIEKNVKVFLNEFNVCKMGL